MAGFECAFLVSACDVRSIRSCILISMGCLVSDSLRSSLACALLGLGLLASGGSLAQTLYRCGATYQDRPCGGTVDSKVLGRAAVSANVDATAATLAPACASRGAAAQKLIWEKESGRTLDEQLSRRGADADFVSSVYSRRGSSVDVRRAVESDCMKEMDRAKEAAALRSAADRLESGIPVGGGDRPLGASRANDRQDIGGGAPTVSRANLPVPVSMCPTLASELMRLNQAQRTGGSASFMDDLAEKVRDVQSRQRANRC